MILYFGLYIFCFTISVCEINKSWIHEQGIFMFVFGSTMQVLAQQQSQCNLLMLLRCNSWGIGLMSFRRLQVLRLQLLIAFKAVMLMQWLYQWYGSILILRSHSSLYSFWRLYLLLLSLCSTAWLDVVGSKRSWILLISGKRNILCLLFWDLPLTFWFLSSRRKPLLEVIIFYTWTIPVMKF